MGSAEGIKVPERVAAYVLEQSPIGGQRWLDGAPVLVERYCRLWDLRVIEVHPSSNRSMVVRVERRNGQQAALRLDPPRLYWADAVKAYALVEVGPNVLADSPVDCVSLVAWVPGRVGSWEDTAAVARALAAPLVTTPDNLPHWTDVIGRLVGISTERAVRIGANNLVEALRRNHANLVRAAASSPVRMTHGDIVPGNVVVDGVRADVKVWLIDPEPCLAPLERDVAMWALRSGMADDVIEQVLDMAARAVEFDRGLAEAFARLNATTYIAYARSVRGKAPPPGAARLAGIDAASGHIAEGVAHHA